VCERRLSLGRLSDPHPPGVESGGALRVMGRGVVDVVRPASSAAEMSRLILLCTIPDDTLSSGIGGPTVGAALRVRRIGRPP